MSADSNDSIQDRRRLLDHLRVVLVGTKFPGNLGMTARAMRNLGLSDLALVRPRAELNKEAYQLAPSAGDVLDSARLCDSLAEAVADCGLVIGTTRRRGVLRRNLLSPEQAGVLLRPALMVNRAALVFGNEESGLANEDLALCHWIVNIHTGSGSESFNLSHAVAIVAYAVNRAAADAQGSGPKLALSRNLEDLFADVARFLVETGFIEEADPKRMMLVIRYLLGRAGVNEREVKIIRGILRQARWRIRHPDAAVVPRGAAPQPKSAAAAGRPADRKDARRRK